MQFVLNMCALDQLAKPYPLCLRGGCEIEHDGDPLRQENANVWRERVLQSRITVHEGRNVGDLARKQGIQEIVLHEKDSIFSNGQISCQSGLACRHLPAQEDQLRWGAHTRFALPPETENPTEENTASRLWLFRGVRWRPGSDQRRWPGIRRIPLERHRNEFGTF